MEIYKVWGSLGVPYEWKVINKKKYLIAKTNKFTKSEFYDPLIQKPDLYLKYGRLKVTELEISRFFQIHGNPGGLEKVIKGTKYRAWDMAYLRQDIKQFRAAINFWAEEPKDLNWSNFGDGYNAWAFLIRQKISTYVKPMIFPSSPRCVWQAHGAIPAAWLQLWMAIGKQAPVAQCSECTNIFELAPTRRFKKKFCSDSCKQKSWRKNRNERAT
jgi:hypothetical protein